MVLDGLKAKVLVLVILVSILAPVTISLTPSLYTEGTALTNEYLSLIIDYSSKRIVNITFNAVSVPDSYGNNSVSGTAYLLIDRNKIMSRCNVSTSPLVSGPTVTPAIKAYLAFSSKREGNTIFYHFKAKTIFVNQTEKKIGEAESYIFFQDTKEPVVEYNLTGTNDLASRFLIAMIRRLLFNPLLATNISEEKEISDGNITIQGRADVINASILLNGEMSFATMGQPVKGAVRYVITELSLAYSIEASYPAPLYGLLREILLKGLNGYRGEQAGILFLTPYLGGFTTVSIREGTNIVNDILTLSLIINTTSVKAGLSSSNNTYKLTMNAYGATDHRPPDVLVALIASTRGYEATNIAKLLASLHEVKPGGKADPKKLLSNTLSILGRPLYSYRPEAYTSNQSFLIINLPNTINETVVDLLENIAAILHVRTTFTIENNKIAKITVKPYPSIREAIAIYMSLNNIGITTSPTTTTTAKSTIISTQAPAQTTTTTTTTTTSPARTTTSPLVTTTKHTVVARTTQPTTTSQAGPAGQVPTTTTLRNTGPGLSPLLALIPLAILGLIILYLHIRAKKKITETLLGQPEETGEETEGETSGQY